MNCAQIVCVGGVYARFTIDFLFYGHSHVFRLRNTLIVIPITQITYLWINYFVIEKSKTYIFQLFIKKSFILKINVCKVAYL